MQAQLDATYQKLLVATGESITKNSELSDGIGLISERFKALADDAQKGGTATGDFFKGLVSNVGLAIQQVDELLTKIRQLQGTGERRGLEVTGTGIQQNLREQGVPTTGLELLDFLGDVKRIAIDTGKSVVDTISDYSGLDEIIGKAPKSPADEFLKKTNEDADKLINNLPKVTEEMVRIAEMSRLIAAQNPFEKLKIDEEIRAANVKYFDDVAKKNKEFADQQEKVRKSFEGASDAISDLRNKLSANPLLAFYDAADQRQRNFFNNFKNATLEQQRLFETFNRETLNLDLFKGKLAFADTTNNLQRELAKLQAGLGGAGLRDQQKSDAAERAAILKEIETGRSEGTLKGFEQDALLLKLSKVGEGSQLERIEAEFRQKSLQSAQGLLGTAQSPVEKNLALQQILSITGDISKLTPGEVDIRGKALTDSLSVQQTLAQETAQREQQRQQTDTKLADSVEKLAAVLGGLDPGVLAKFIEAVDRGVTVKVQATDGYGIDLGRIDVLPDNR